MNQNFSSQQLIKFCKQTDLGDYKLTGDELLVKLDNTFENIKNNTFNFNIDKVGDYYLVSDLTHKRNLTHKRDLTHKLVLRKLNDNIKKLYKEEQANRRIIISQVKTLLEETCPMWILKTDIENFYECIQRTILLAKLQNDAMLSFHSIQLLNSLFNHPLLESETGIPRGMNISATLSEIYMRKFDRWIRRYPGVYYYARYVDDIIIFSNNKKTIETISDEIDNHLEDGLRKNEEKTSIFNGEEILDSKSLDYLGYKFTIKKVKKKKYLTVSIVDKKIRKIKSRITLSFIDYVKTKDFELLSRRIKFLSGNYRVRKNKYGNDLKAGIYYNYSHVSNCSVFHELNLYYRKALYSKKSTFGKKLSKALTTSQKRKLSRYSFKYGFINKVYNSFTLKDMYEIKSCWQ